jgi:hypothetical protein
MAWHSANGSFFMVKIAVLLLLIWSAYKFCKELYLLIASFFEQISYNNNHCSDCGAELITYGYDEKRGCPNRCAWKKWEREHDK